MKRLLHSKRAGQILFMTGLQEVEEAIGENKVACGG